MRSPSLTKLDMGIEEMYAILAPTKLVRIRRSFASRGAENMGENAPSNLKPHNSEILCVNQSKF